MTGQWTLPPQTLAELLTTKKTTETICCGNLGSVPCNEVCGNKKLPKALIRTKQSRELTVNQLEKWSHCPSFKSTSNWGLSLTIHHDKNMPPCKWGKDICPCQFLQWLIVQLAQHNRGICLAYQWKHGTVFWFLVGFPNWHVSGCHFQVPVGAWSCLLVLSKTGKNGSLGMMPLVDS